MRIAAKVGTQPHRAAEQPPAGLRARHSLGRKAWNVLRCRGGGEALSFAIISVPFMVICMVSLEIAWQMATSLALDHAAMQAGRFGSLGKNSIEETGSPDCRSQTISWVAGRATAASCKRAD